MNLFKKIVIKQKNSTHTSFPKSRHINEKFQLETWDFMNNSGMV